MLSKNLLPILCAWHASYQIISAAKSSSKYDFGPEAKIDGKFKNCDASKFLKTIFKKQKKGILFENDYELEAQYDYEFDFYRLSCETSSKDLKKGLGNLWFTDKKNGKIMNNWSRDTYFSCRKIKKGKKVEYAWFTNDFSEMNNDNLSYDKKDETILKPNLYKSMVCESLDYSLLPNPSEDDCNEYSVMNDPHSYKKICQWCNSGKELDHNGNCASSCMDPNYPDYNNITTLPPHGNCICQNGIPDWSMQCDGYNGQSDVNTGMGACSTCNYGYELDYGYCYQKYGFCNNGYSDVYYKKRSSLYNDTSEYCTSCYEGYYLSYDNLCLPESNFDVDCLCRNGTVVDATVNATCNQYGDLDYNHGACATCDYGFYYSYGWCIRIENNCPNGIPAAYDTTGMSTNNIRTSRQYNDYYNNNVLPTASANNYTSTTKCSSCYDGFYLTAEETCYPNICTCSFGGEAGRGYECYLDGAEFCSWCYDGHTWNNGTCTRNECFCDHGDPAPAESVSNWKINNNYKRSNSRAPVLNRETRQAWQPNCYQNGAHICAADSCNNGYIYDWGTQQCVDISDALECDFGYHYNSYYATQCQLNYAYCRDGKAPNEVAGQVASANNIEECLRDHCDFGYTWSASNECVPENCECLNDASVDRVECRMNCLASSYVHIFGNNQSDEFCSVVPKKWRPDPSDYYTYGTAGYSTGTYYNEYNDINKNKFECSTNPAEERTVYKIKRYENVLASFNSSYYQGEYIYAIAEYTSHWNKTTWDNDALFMKMNMNSVNLHVDHGHVSFDWRHSFKWGPDEAIKNWQSAINNTSSTSSYIEFYNSDMFFYIEPIILDDAIRFQIGPVVDGSSILSVQDDNRLCTKDETIGNFQNSFDLVPVWSEVINF